MASPKVGGGREAGYYVLGMADPKTVFAVVEIVWFAREPVLVAERLAGDPAELAGLANALTSQPDNTLVLPAPKAKDKVHLRL
jgi:hypothetical protein